VRIAMAVGSSLVVGGLPHSACMRLAQPSLAVTSEGPSGRAVAI
jgi:hypothetical protein